MLEDLQIPANSVLHIGDNLVDDLEGASRVGMHGIVVKRKVTISPASPCPAGLTIDALTDLKNRFCTH